MTGSSLAPIIIPLVVVPVLAFWLIAVAWADKHPRWRARGRQRGSGDVARLRPAGHGHGRRAA